MRFPDMRSFTQHYRCFSVSMLPGNERNDVENGGKSLFCNFLHCHLKNNQIVFFSSYYATVGLGSADTTEHRVSYAI